MEVSSFSSLVELASLLCEGLCCARSGHTPTEIADAQERLGSSTAPSLKTLNMLDVCLTADGKARSLEPPHAELNSIE